MARQTLITKKRRGPKPTGVGTLVGVRMQPDELARLDAWISDQFSGYTRPEAIRALVDLGMEYGKRGQRPNKAKR